MLNLTNIELILHNTITGEDTIIPPSGTVADYEIVYEDLRYNPSVRMEVVIIEYGVINVPSIPCEPFIVKPVVLRKLDKSYRGIAFTWEDRELRSDGSSAITSLKTV